MKHWNLWHLLVWIVFLAGIILNNAWIFCAGFVFLTGFYMVTESMDSKNYNGYEDL